MLIFLPILTVLIVFLDLLGMQKEIPSRFKGGRVALLQAVLIAGVFIALQSEILGLFKLLTMPFVAGAWLVALLVSTWLGWHGGVLLRGWKRLIASFRSLDSFVIVTLVAFSMISLLLLIIALVVPPNNMDSLLYHMSRVMHWAQDRNLAHYPVGFQPQLTNPIEAELIILQLRLLWGNDQLANIPQWFSLILCAIAVSLGAKLLGAGSKGELAAAAFAISIPIGLLQATSTQNDYVTALWLIILAVFVLLAYQEDSDWAGIMSISAALGLGLLTKGTFYPYAVAWGILLIIPWLKKRNPLMILKRSLVIVFIVVLLNAGYWSRNIITYGGPLGSQKWITSMTSASFGVSSIPSNLVKNILLNLATPSPRVNQVIVNFVHATFRASDPDVESFQLDWRWSNEDQAGNPIHLFLVVIIIASTILLFSLGRLKEHHIFWYCLAAFFSFILFSVVAPYDQYGIRYQLPLFVLWAPAFGMILSRLSERWLASVAIIILFVISLPYAFFNSTRPLIAMKNDPEPYAIHPLPGMGETKSSSIFYASQQSLLFANTPELNQPYEGITHDIRHSGCAQVGLQIDSHDLEYPFWWLLNAPQSGIRIESIYYSDQLARYVDRNFKPCAIICTICGGRTKLHGLDRSGSYGGVMTLFLGNTYNPYEDQ